MKKALHRWRAFAFAARRDWLPESDSGQNDSSLYIEFPFGVVLAAKGVKRLLPQEALEDASRIVLPKLPMRTRNDRRRFAKDCMELLRVKPALTQRTLANRLGMTPARLSQILGLLGGGLGR